MKGRSKLVWAPLLALGLALFAPRFAAGDADSRPMNRRFLEDAYQWTIAITEMSKLAHDRSNGDTIRRYAEKILAVQEGMREEIRGVAEHHDIHLRDDLNQTQHDMVDHLRGLHGYAFDRDYTAEQRGDLQLMIDLFKQAHEQCTEEGLRTFAGEKLPELRQYHDDAEELYQKVKEKGHD
jgi:predicted outer membrane protein